MVAVGVVVAVIGIGSLWVYNGDGFIVVEVATIWVRFRWLLGLWVFGSDLGGVWIKFGGVWVAFWVAIVWLSFGGRCCVCLLERETKRRRGVRDGRLEREIELFMLFVSIVYIILMSCKNKN